MKLRPHFLAGGPLTASIVIALSSMAFLTNASAQLLSATQEQATPVSPISETADRNSKFYLLLDDDSLSSNQAYQSEIKQIDQLGRAQDLTGLSKIADSIEQTWGHQADTRGYFALMDEVTNVLRSDTFASANFVEQYGLAQKYVLAPLAHGDVPLDITARLLPRLVPEETLTLYEKPFDASSWVEVRHNRALLWLQTRQRLKKLVVPNYDFTSPTFFNLPLDLQNDPKKDAARQKEIQENNRKIQERNDQSLVKLQDKIFAPMAESEMIVYYSQSPYNTTELKHLLDTYVDDSATRQSILDQVAKNIASASHKQ